MSNRAGFYIVVQLSWLKSVAFVRRSAVQIRPRQQLVTTTEHLQSFNGKNRACGGMASESETTQ